MKSPEYPSHQLKKSSILLDTLRRHFKRPVAIALALFFPLWTMQVRGATLYYLGSDRPWDTVTNQWSATNDLLGATPWVQGDVAAFIGVPGTITLSGPITASGLIFSSDGNVITGDTLTLSAMAGENSPILNVAAFKRATIESIIAGTDGFTKTGNGTLLLGSAANSFSGDIAIKGGVLVVSNVNQLGTGTTAISITGVAQSGNPGFSGGTLMLAGSNTASGLGMTLNREVSVSGRGPGSVNNTGGLVSVGYNTLAGGLTLGATGTVENRVWATHGTTTITGGVDLGVAGAGNVFQGNGNWTISGVVTGSENLNDRFIKTGQLITTTLWLQNAGNTFTDSIRVDSGTVRVATNSALGQNLGAGQVDLNNGTLEIRTDAAADFAGRTVRIRNNTTGTIFVDHDLSGGLGIGTSMQNQTVTMGALIRDAGANAGNYTFNGRNGYNVSFTSYFPAVGDYRGETITNNSSGTVTINGNVWNANNATASTFTVTGSGDTVITGSVVTTAVANVLTKGGTGTFFYGGSAGTYQGATNISAGTFSLANLGGIAGTSQINIGNATTTSGSLTYTGGADTLSKNILLNSTTANAYINASGTGALILSGNILTTVNGAKTLVLGGTNTDANEIQSAIGDSTSATNLQKIGSGTWVLSGANTFNTIVTGATGITISGGTLAVQDTFSGGSRNVIVNTAAIVFNVDAFTQSAGGTFEYRGAASSASTESVGALTLTAGAGTIRLTPGAGGTTALTFASLGTVTAGSGVNIAAASGTVTVTGVPTSTATTLPGNGHIYINGADFARSNGGAMVTPVYGTDAGFVVAGAALTAANHNLVTAGTSSGAMTISSLKISGSQTVAQTGLLTINVGANTSGGILQTGGSGTISGTGVTTSGSGDLVIRVDGAGDQLTMMAPITATTTGGLTKNGDGLLLLQGAQAYLGGATTINQGQITLDTGSRLGGASASNNNNLVIRQDGKLDINGNSIGVGAFNGAGLVTNTGAAATFTIGNNNQVGVFSGLITGSLSLIKAGTGTTMSLTGMNTYTGATTITGTLVVNNLANIGSPSAIGLGDLTSDVTNAASLVFVGGSLQYTGANAQIYQTTQTPSISINRLFTLGGNGTIDSSGSFGAPNLTHAANSASLIFNNTADVAFSGATGARLLTLTGDSIGDNEIRLHLIDNNIPTTGFNVLSLTKASSSLWILNPSSSNTYTGTTTISGGALRVASSAAAVQGLSEFSPLVINGGVLETSGAFTRTLGAPVAGTGTVQISGGASGFSAATTDRLLVTIGGGGLTWGSTNFNPSSLVLGSSTALGETEITNNINLQATARTITVNNNGNTGAMVTAGILSGVISGSANITKNGGGVLILGDANTYTGNTILNNGYLVITSFGNASGTTRSSLGASGGTFNFNSATTTVAVSYVGSGETASRPWSITSGASTQRIDSSGSGALTLTGAFTNTSTGAISLELRGSNTDLNTVSSILTDNAANTFALRLLKNDGGVWVLSGNNTYTGGTRSDGGLLGFSSAAALGTATPSVLGGNNSVSSTTVTVASTAGLVPGMYLSGNGLAFGDVISSITNGTQIVISTARIIPNNSTIYFGGLLSNSGGFFATDPAGLTIVHSLTINPNTATTFSGANSITLSGDILGPSGNPWTISNNLDNTAVLTISGAFHSLDTSSVRNLQIRGTGATVITGDITDSTAAAFATNLDIRMADGATVTLSGATATTYTGYTLLGQGTLILNKDSGVAQFGASSSFIFDGGFLQAGLALTDANKINTQVTLGGDQATIIGINSIDFGAATALVNSGGNRFLRNELTGGASLTISGAVNLSESATTGRTLTIRGSGDTLISGIVANGGTGAGGLSYSGLGTLTLTNVNTATGALTVNRNTIVLSGAGAAGGAWNLGTVTLNPIGVLTLDNSAGNTTAGVTSNRLSDTLAFTGQGGKLNIIGASGGTDEVVGALTLNNVQTFITLTDNSGGAGNNLTFASVTFTNSATVNGSSLNLAGVPALGTTNKVLFTSAPSGAAIVFNGVIPRVFLGGTDFAKYDVTNGVVPLVSGDYNNSNDLNAAAATDAMDLTASSSLTASRTVNALKLDGIGVSAGGSTGTRLTLTSGGILNTGGNNSLDVPSIAFTNTPVIQVQAGTTLNVNSTLVGAVNFIKALPGTLILNTPSFLSGTHNLLNGVTKLNVGLNTFFPGQTLNINDGATLDLNGNAQLIGQLTDPGVLPEAGGLITSNNGDALLVANSGTSATVATNINDGTRGTIAFAKAGANTITLESVNTYSGATTLLGGTLQLQDDSTILSSTSISINAATLLLNNNSSLQRAVYDRIGDTAPITLRDGTLSFTGKVSDASTETFGAVTSAQGANTITATAGGAGTAGAVYSVDLTFASLTRNAGTTINFTGTNLGQQGNSSRIVFTAPLTTNANGALGAWAIANSSDYAAYNTGIGIGIVGQGGFTGYEGTFASGNITEIPASAATTTTLSGATNTGLLHIAGAFTNDIAFTTATDSLNLEQGGILRSNNNNATTIGTASIRGHITSGIDELIVYNNQGTTTINSFIEGATTRLIKSGGGTLSLTANNSYLGGTTVDQGTLTLNGTGVVIPGGGLTIGGATVTMVTNAGQIDPSNAVTIRRSSTLTLVGNNTLDSLAFDNNGGTTASTVNVGGVLTLSNATPISVITNNAGTTPLITGGTLALAGGAKTFDIGPINIDGTTYTAIQASLSIASIIAGPGTVTKSGTGLLQLSGQSTFSGLNVTSGGIIVAGNSTQNAGTVTSGPLGTGLVAMSASTVLVASASNTLANPFSFAGTPTFDSTANTAWTLSLTGALSGVGLAGPAITVNVINPSLTVALLGSFPGTFSSITKTGAGTLIFNATNYTGDFNATALGNPNAITLINDGDGTGSVQTLGMGNVVFDAGIVPNITINRGGSLPFGAAVNKILAPTSITNTGLGLTVTVNAGYGLQVSDATSFTSTPTINVSGTQASNITQGLYLTGDLTGTGFNKTGSGTLVINNATPANNTFTGNINITQGVVSVGADGQLGNSANLIVLNPSAGTSAFRSTGTFATSQVIQLASTAFIRAIEVSNGNTLTLNSAFDLNGGAGNTASLNKQDLGTLVINASNTGWSGQINIVEGAILINNPALTNPLGTGVINASNAGVIGSVLQLAGGVTINNPLTLQGTANILNAGTNFQGVLDNVSGINTYAGVITQGFDTTIGARAGSTLNITGGIVGAAHRLQFNAEGDINITTTSLTSALYGFDKFGAGTLTISVAIVPATTGTGILIHAGTMVLNGTGTTLATAGGNIVYNGATLTLDNSGTNTNNRLNGKALNLQGGAFNFISNNSTETVGVLTSDQGSNVITLSGTGTAGLTFASLTTAAGSTLDVQGTIGTATNFLKFTSNPALTPAITGILNRVTVNGSELASYSASLGVIPFTNYSPATNILGATATAVFKATTSTINSLATSQTINALTINNTAAVGGLNGNPPVSLTLTSGTILANGTGGAFLNTPIVSLGAEGLIHVQSGQSLTVNSGLSGTSGMTKDLPGTLNLNAQQFVSGATYINEGKTVLTSTGITNPMLYNQSLAVNYGGTLDLNGNNQFVAGLSSATAGGGNGIAGGTVTNSALAQSTFTVNGNTNFAGVISGNIFLNKSGTGALNLQNAQTYTGATLITGGTLTLNDYGALPSTTQSITINYGGLSLANGNLYNVNDRVNDSAPITMAGGTLSYAGRPQMSTTETLGAVTLTEGLNYINATTGGTNVNSAVLTLASLTRSVGSTATLRFNGSSNVLGAIGSTPNILVTTAPTLTNNIIGPWAIVDREWASYDSTYGIGQLNQNGFAGYSGTSLMGGPGDTDNVRFFTAGTTVLTGNTTVGTLNFASQTAATVLDLGGNTLTVQGGGILFGQATDNVDFSIQNGTITGPSGGGDFYLTHANFAGTNRTVTLNAPITDNGGASRVIFTSGQIEAAGVGNTNLNAVSTNTGGTVINSGNIVLGATGALGTGGLAVNQGIFTQTLGGVIPSTNMLTMGGGSLVILANQANTLAGITFNNLGGAAPTVTPTGTLTLTSGITVNTINAGGIAVIGAGNLDLNNAGSFAINVGATVVNGVDIAPWQAGLNISSLIQNGGITKSGNGLLQLSNAISTFSGGINVTSGGLVIGASSTGANLLDPVSVGPLGTGAVTMAGGTTLVSTGAFAVANDFTFLGDTVLNGTSSLTLNGNTTLPTTWNVAVTAPNVIFTIGNVVGSVVTDEVNKSGLGQLVLGNYNGTINIAGGLILSADGNTLGTPESLSLGGGIALTDDTQITVNKSGGAPNARNKTLQKTTLTNNGSILAINNLNGYGLEITGNTILTGASTLAVGIASASNVVQGLTLSGVVSDTGGFTLVKSGLGTLALTNSGNTFGGAGQTIDVLGGILSVNSDGALGNAANTITLEVDGTTGSGFRSTGTFSTARTFLLNAPNNAFEVTQGNTLTLTTPFSLLSANNTLTKNDNGVFVINADNTGWTGTITINGGAIEADNSNALGSGTVTVVNTSGSALQLNGGVTVANLLTIGSSGMSTTGALRSIAGSNIYSGAITLTAASTIGSDAGSLELKGGVSGAFALTLAGAGNISITTTALAASLTNITKINSGTATLGVNSSSYVGTLTINAGSFVIAGSGIGVGGTGLITINPTGSLIEDDSSGAASAHLGGRALTLAGGTFSYLGNGGTSAETFGTLTTNRPGDRVSVNNNGGSTTLTFASLGGTGNIVTLDGALSFVSTGAAFGTTGANSNRILFSTAPTLTNSIIQRATVNGADFATYGANGIAAFTAYNAGSTTNINSVTTTTGTADVNAAMTTKNLAANKALNAIRLSGATNQVVGATGANFLAGGNTPAVLTLSAGAVIATGGGSHQIATPILAPGISTGTTNVQDFFSVDSATTLTITSILTGNAGWVKAGAGTLILAPPTSSIDNRTANTITGNATLTGGTVILNGGNNTLVANQNMLVGPGATLDLNGNSQFIQILFTDTGAVEGAGGTITSTGVNAANGTLVTNQDNNTRNWAGTITGALSFARGGQGTMVMFSNNDYTGSTLITGGTTTLKDGGRLSGTTAIEIVYSTLNIDNTGTKDLTDRINDTAAINLRGGTLAFLGRAQTASTETVGGVSLLKGNSFINSTLGGTGINSADLTLTSLNRAVGGGTVNFTAATGGQIGSSARILIPTINGVSTDAVGGGLTNGIIGGWAIIGTSDFATYIPGLGVAAMGANGALQYSNATSNLATLNSASATDNISINVAVPGSVVPVSDNLTINSLRMGNIAAQTVDIAAGKTLTLSSGGLLFFSTASQKIGSVVNQGSLTTTGPELFIYTQGTGPQIINSVISGSGVTLVKSGSGALTLNGTNTYDGGTIINQGTLTLGLTSNIPLAADPTKGLILNGSSFSISAPGQIDPANIVTINGNSSLTLLGDNTLAGLIFRDDGGGIGASQIVSNLGVLTINGNVVSTTENPSSTSTLVGRVDFGSTNRTLDISATNFNGQELAALLSDFNLQGVVNSAGGITKIGDGVLQFSAPDIYTGTTTVNAGRIQIGVANGGSRFSDYDLNGTNTGLNLNALATVLGSISGTGYVTNSGAAATLTVGFDGSSTTFSGTFLRFNDVVLNAVSLNKIGAGTLTFDSSGTASTTTGSLSISRGAVTFKDNGTSSFENTAIIVNEGATLNLNNSTATSSANLANRLLGGALTLNGGTFNVLGVDGGATADVAGVLTLGPSASNINLTAGTGGTIVETFASLTQNAGSTAIISGTSLGTGTILKFTTAPTLVPATTGILARIEVGTDFATYNSTNGIIAFTGYAIPADINLAAATATIKVDATTTVRALDLGRTINALNIMDDNVVLTSNGTLLPTQGWTVTSGGILVNGGNASISTPVLALGAEGIFRINGSSLNVTSSITGTAGITKTGSGSMTLSTLQSYTSQTALNLGSLTLAGGNNTLLVTPTATIPGVADLQVNGGLLDLNGYNQAVRTLLDSNTLAFIAGEITNSSTTAVTLTTATATSSVFGGKISGNLGLTRSGNNTLTLVDAQTYTGATIIRGGGLTLQDTASLATSSITLDFGTLTLNNNNLNSMAALNPVRFAASTPVTMLGGTLVFSPGGSVDNTTTINTVTILAGGANTITPNGVTGGTNTVNIGNLILPKNTGTTLNVSTGVGQPTTSGAQLFLTQLNGVAPTNNAFLGTNIIINTNDYGVYNTVQGFIAYGGAAVTGNTVPAYAAALASGNNLPANIANTGTATAIAAATTIGAVRFSGTTTAAVTFTNGTSTGGPDTLNIAMGGILHDNTSGAVNIGTATARGILTTGGTATTGTTDFVVYNNQNTITINSVIADNGLGNLTRYVKSGAATQTLTASNTYTGGTIVDQGTLNLSGTTAGFTVIPVGGLTINNATVTMNTNAGQIDASNDVFINGGGLLTTVGSNTLNSVTFNNTGGTATPTLNSGTKLNFTAATPITATNDSFSTTPTISGTEIGLADGATIVTSGLSPDNLIISAKISTTAATAPLVKSGSGSLVLSNATSAFANGFNLDQGSLIFAANSTPTSGVVTAGPIGTGALNIANGTAVLSDGTARTIANAVNVAGDFTFGTPDTASSRATAGNSLILSGITTLAAGAHNITVGGLLMTGTLSGQVTGGTNLSKDGLGTLVLSNTGNDYGGTTTITAGTLQLGAAGVIPDASALVVATNGNVNINGFAETVGSLSGAGLITNTGAAATLTTGGDGTSTTFSGFLSNQANALNLVKTLGGTQTLTGANSYTGTTAVNAGVLNIQNNTALGTTAGGTTVASGAALEIQGGITVGAEALNITGTGVAGDGALRSISGTNIYGGTITLGTGGATIQSDAGLLTLNAATAIAATTQPLTIEGAGDTTVSGAITGTTATLTKNDAGVVTLSGANTTAGDLMVNGGEVDLNTTAANAWSGNAVVNMTAILKLLQSNQIADSKFLSVAGGTFRLNGFNETVAGVSLTNGGSILDGVGGGALTSTTDFDLQSGTASGVLAGSVGATKSTGGTVILSGANTYTGKTAVNGGTLSISADNNLGIAPAGVVADQLTLNGGVLQTTADVALAANRGITVATAGGTFETAASTTTTVSSAITGDGVINKTGAGILLVTATNTNTGATNVNAGTLGGTGTLGGDLNVNSGGTVAPGIAAEGLLTIGGNLTVTSGGTLLMQLGGATLNDEASVRGNENSLNSLAPSVIAGWESASTALHDRIVSNGATAPMIDGTLRIDSTFLKGYTPVFGDVLNLLDWSGVGGITGNTNFDYSGINLGGDLTFNSQLFVSNGILVVVPEPGRVFLLMFGLLGLLMRRRRDFAA